MNCHTPQIDSLLREALIEDQATHDVTTQLTVDANLRGTARILARQEMVVCGLGVIERFFEHFAELGESEAARACYKVEIQPGIVDGVRVQDGQVLAVIHHRAATLLSCERVILNLMQHLSGIATEVRRYVDAIDGTGARLLDTRKTIPGLRVLEKYAVACGGGTNHRLDLASGILIKNNHIALGGGVRAAVEHALAGRAPGLRVQVEVRTPEELEDALLAGAEAVLLDNMTPEQVRRSVERIHAATEGKAPVSTEASGGITLASIRSYAEAGADFISVGALTHSVPAADISMRIELEN
ncbi:carboxylating nicotinate-nucleotide diphosphorylase [Telmatobacter bradus]|uniref:carboxylating nicotinate-nucleotide diphosphorylase n=1 Tax=Telmatobacter bradus TaxID=474953 RepID=UPI003B42ECDB